MLWWAAWECLCLRTPCCSLDANYAIPPTPRFSPPGSLMFFIHCLTIGGLMPSGKTFLQVLKWTGLAFPHGLHLVSVKAGRCRPIPAVCPLLLLCHPDFSTVHSVPKCEDDPHTFSMTQWQPPPRFKVTESTSFPYMAV